MLATRLEYQSWLIETSGVNILIDPWLTREDLLVSYPWVLRRPHSKRSNPSILHGLDIHVILLTSHFEDHLHINSLLSLPKETLCVGTKKAVKKIQHHGFNNCLSIQAESKTDIGVVEIKALKSGFPYSYNSLAFLIKDKSKDKSLLLEPHVLNKSTIKHCFNLSALITTIESVKLLGLELSMNPYKTMTYLKNLKPEPIDVHRLGHYSVPLFKCDNNKNSQFIEKKPNHYISKFQFNDKSSRNEIEIGKIIKTINNYLYFEF